MADADTDHRRDTITRVVANIQVPDEFTLRDHLTFIAALVDRAHDELIITNTCIAMNGGLGEGLDERVSQLRDVQAGLEGCLQNLDDVIGGLPWARDDGDAS